MGRARAWLLRTWLISAAALTLVLTPGCGLVGDRPGEAVPDAVEPSIEKSPSPEPGVPSPEPSSPSPSATSSKPKAAKPTPTEAPNNFTEPECAEHEGRNVSKAKAKAALTAAAGRTYWPGSAPELEVPARLVIAVAWHESGWQSSIVNCDGGRGLMQVMPDTEAFINQRFDKSYDSHDYRENATLGANYLAWLTKAFGDAYFNGSYDLSARKCRTHESMCLLNLVIAGYNAGRGAVDAAYADRRLPNPRYVDSVRSLMKSCYCDRY